MLPEKIRRALASAIDTPISFAKSTKVWQRAFGQNFYTGGGAARTILASANQQFQYDFVSKIGSDGNYQKPTRSYRDRKNNAFFMH